MTLTFKPCNWELPYWNEPDHLFKFYIICSLMILIFIGMILAIPTYNLPQWVNHNKFLNSKNYMHENIKYFCFNFRWPVLVKILYCFALLFILFLVPLTWTHFVWNRRKDPYEECSRQPKNKIINMFYQASILVIKIFIFFKNYQIIIFEWMINYMILSIGCLECPIKNSSLCYSCNNVDNVWCV